MPSIDVMVKRTDHNTLPRRQKKRNFEQKRKFFSFSLKEKREEEKEKEKEKRKKIHMFI